DALAHAFAKRLARHCEEQECHARTAVGRLLGRQFALDPGFEATADHRGGKARRRDAGLARPRRTVGGDDEPRSPHLEGLGEGVVDLDLAELHARLRGRQACVIKWPPAPSISAGARRKWSRPTLM